MGDAPNRSEAGLSEVVVVRISKAMLAMVDLYAIREERSRASFIRRAIAAEVGSRQGNPSIEEMIEASSLGTPEAKAIRESVPVEQARAVVQRAAEVARTHKFKPRASNALRCDTCGLPKRDHR